MSNATLRLRSIRWAAFLVVALLGLALRLPQLGARPMHTDEAVNAYIVGQLLAGERFTYDPQDHHGPALAALAMPLSRLQQAKSFSDLTESKLRLTSVVAGTITILLFGAAVEMFGFRPCLLAALLFAGAPLPLYYDRYFIHESLFVAATFGLILAGWRVLTGNNSANPPACQLAMSRRDANSRKIKPVYAALAAACAALMLACKESAVIHFFALAAAAFALLWNPPLSRHPDRRSPRRPKWRDLRLYSHGLEWSTVSCLTAVVTFLLLTIMLFTWFGTNWKAPLALWQAIPHVLARAGGEGHQKPFWYYAQLLTGGWSGGMLFALACIGFILTVRKPAPSPYLFLAWYSFSLTAIYSLIPYKTPWLALNFWLPIALFAARAIESLWRMAAKYASLRVALPVFATASTLAVTLIAHDTRQRVFKHPAEETNPYAYAHTSEDLLGLPAEIEELARQNAIGTPRIAVIASDPWPLPWYLRHYSQVGFWQPGQQVGEADLYITSTDAAEHYADRLRNYRPEFFGVRPGVLILLWSPAPK